LLRYVLIVVSAAQIYVVNLNAMYVLPLIILLCVVCVCVVYNMQDHLTGNGRNGHSSNGQQRSLPRPHHASPSAATQHPQPRRCLRCICGVLVRVDLAHVDERVGVETRLIGWRRAVLVFDWLTPSCVLVFHWSTGYHYKIIGLATILLVH
jgi:hypothetical protein